MQEAKIRTRFMKPQELKNLPIGVQDFEKLREGGYLYLDKTAALYDIVANGNYYFLSRPRRFGKSLLLSTLKAYFQGKRELFAGLAIEKLENDWEEHAVLYLDLNTENYSTAEALRSKLCAMLSVWEEIYGANESEKTLSVRFEGVIRRAYEKTGRRVVVLVDEYDKPLLQAIGKPELQEEYRATLKGFYGALKSMDGCIVFAMLTGVTKFGKVSVFSDLNNLKDISMDSRYYSICGISKGELLGTMRPYVERLAEARGISTEEAYAEMKRRYDGYHFTEDTDGMYNPFSVLNAVDAMKFGSYWFETGTPSYLVELLKRNHYNLEKMANEEVTISILKSIDATASDPIPVLFQSGYLTIKGYDERFGIYRLGFPNEEVKEGFLEYLMPFYASIGINQAGFHIMNFVREVEGGRVDDFMARLKSFFADTPYELVRDLENHYQNVLFILCNLCGLYTKAEYHTSQGRIDMTIETPDYVYVFEFKFNRSAVEALRQIRENGYAEPFRASGKQVVCIGVNFDSGIRSIDGYVVG